MTSTIDDLLADAVVPTASSPTFDVGAALCRLAADAAQTAPPRDMVRAAQAGQTLAVVSRWILNEPDAASHVDRLARGPQTVPPGEEHLDIEGATVFACLLYLTGHPESAQFWWQLAAGASHRPAAYCLHLHHLALGERREAEHWRHEVMIETDAPDEELLNNLEVVARYVRGNGSAASAPTGGLEMEVDRLADNGTHSCIIVGGPDRRLADRLHNFTRR